MAFIMAQVMGLVGTISNMISVQLKSRKSILLLFIIYNIAFGISFLLLGSYTGAVINIIAAIQTWINYYYEIRKKEFPKMLIPIYIVVSLICGGISYRQIIDILPLICSVLYTITIIQKKESMIRKLTFVSILLWLWYDMVVGAYTAGISNIFFVISSIIGIIRLDIIRRKVIMIDKVAWIEIKDHKILSTLSKGKEKFYIPRRKKRKWRI